MALELPLDAMPDACESPLLDPGSDGLVQGSPRRILEQLADYKDAGQDMTRIRRDFALSPDVTNSEIERSAAYGRWLRAGGQPPTIPTHEAQQQARPDADRSRPGRLFSIPCPWKREEAH